MTGCGKDGKESQTTPTPTSAASETSEEKEPALSEDAKQNRQFSDLKKGDVYAEIQIKNFGTITVKFFPEDAPLAVENFITHAKNGYYDGVSFHRVMNDFMIQGGDPDGTGYGGESIWGKAFDDEFADDLHPFRGALCMANAGVNTNGSQFFLVQAGAQSIEEMERLLEAQYEMPLGKYFEAAYGITFTDEQVEQYRIYGGTPWLFGHHTVFGQMIDGYEVLDKVAGVKVDGNNRPEEAVIIESITVKEYGTDK